jgi:hypothetical protein
MSSLILYYIQLFTKCREVVGELPSAATEARAARMTQAQGAAI